MADSVLKGISDEAFELVKKTGSEIKNQASGAAADIAATVGVKMQGPAEKDSGIKSLRLQDAQQTAAKLPQIRQSLFAEIQSGTPHAPVRESNAQRAAEQQKSANRRPIQQQPADLSSVGSKPKPGSLFSSSKERVKKTQ